MPTLHHPIAGNVRYQILRKGAIRLLDGWAERNISRVHIPQLKGVQTYGMKFSGNVMFYTKAIPQLVAAFKAVEEAGYLDQIIHWGGSWVPRMKRGSSTSPSDHSVATAFDINADWNGFKQRPADKGEKGYLGDVARIFKMYGFEWGGDWQNVPDGMHFQVRKILSSQEIAAVDKSLRSGVARRNTDTVPTPAIVETPKLVIVWKDKSGELHRSLLQTSTLKGGRFQVQASELAAVLNHSKGIVSVREFLDDNNIKPYDEKDFISSKNRYEVYI